ncbi:MAG: PHP domain-containing protein, partial [Clostridia bacterium]|nr:PHP domain-containing protein [Clostridia bacterium]
MLIYETHQHTSGCSRCAGVSPEDMVLSIKESGFSGVIVTNHFYHGNSSIDRSLPWAEFCKAYEDDYLAAKRAGEKIGIDVIYGLEEHVGGGKEVLIYGVEPDYIAKYPELSEINLPLLSEIVRSAGGLLIQAHPFRERAYISDPDALL